MGNPDYSFPYPHFLNLVAITFKLPIFSIKLIISEIDLLQVAPGALIQAETCFEKFPKIVCA